MNNKKPLPPVVIFAILTTVTTFIWIGFEVYREYTKEPEPEVPAAVIAPLNPTLDEEVLNKVTQSVYLQEEEIGVTVLLENEPSATPTAAPEAVEDELAVPGFETIIPTPTGAGTEN